MKVKKILILIELNSKTYKTIIIAWKEVSWIRKIIQASPGQSQKGTNAQIIRRKEKKHSPKWYWKIKNGTKETN